MADVGGFLKRNAGRIATAVAPVTNALATGGGSVSRGVRGVTNALGLTESERQKRLARQQADLQRQAETRARALDAEREQLRGAPTAAPQIGGGFAPSAQAQGGAFARNPALAQGAVAQAPVAPVGNPALAQPMQAPAAPLGGAGQAVASQQSQLGQAILSRALGTAGPSVAEIQMQQARDAALANQFALAASNRGVSSGLASRQAALGTAQVQSQAAAQGAMLRAQEQQAAQGLATQALAGQRGQDIQTALGQARLDSQEDLANLNARLQVMGLDQRERIALLQAALMERGFSADQAARAMAQENARQSGMRELIMGGISAGASALAGAPT